MVSASAEVVFIWSSIFYRRWASADVLAALAVPYSGMTAKYLIFNRHKAERTFFRANFG
jgi:hypothetical protein